MEPKYVLLMACMIYYGQTLFILALHGPFAHSRLQTSIELLKDAKCTINQKVLNKKWPSTT